MSQWLRGTERYALEAEGIGSMPKYDPLGKHLSGQQRPEVMMAFTEVEKVLGASLPPSARTYRAWWANERSGSHVQREAWLGSGYEVDQVDFMRERVVFRRKRV